MSAVTRHTGFLVVCVCGGGGSLKTAHRAEGINYVCRAGSSDSGTVHLNLPSRGWPHPRPEGMGWFGPQPGKGFKSGWKSPGGSGFPVSSEPSDHMGYKDDFVGFLYVSPELQQG